MHHGRDVITITSVGRRRLEYRNSLPGDTDVPRRTAAMAMAAHPQRSAAFTVASIWSGERPLAARKVFTSLA